jgi:hypothetical protein
VFHLIWPVLSTAYDPFGQLTGRSQAWNRTIDYQIVLPVLVINIAITACLPRGEVLLSEFLNWKSDIRVFNRLSLLWNIKIW